MARASLVTRFTVGLASVALAIVGFGTPVLGAPAPHLLRDINTANASSNPRLIVDVNGVAYLFACDGSENAVLWTSDASGTHRVKRIGLCSEGDAYIVRDAVASAGRLFFTLSKPDCGAELWISDGTTAGTRRIRVLPSLPTEISCYPTVSGLAPLHGTVYFTTGTPSSAGLWRSDGTAAGTKRIKMIPGAGAATIAAGNRLYLTAHSDELWRSDGTAAGTVLLKKLASLKNIRELVAVGHRAFFTVNETLPPYEDGPDPATQLWTSDGTTAGTHRVMDISPGGDDTIRSLTPVGHTLFFSARDGTHGTEIWRSDGTHAGTRMVKNINPSGWSDPADLIAVGNRLSFTASNGSARSLWKSDGTASGTRLVKHVVPKHNLDGPGDALQAAVGSTLYFSADGPGGVELWKSNGTAAGTHPVSDIAPGARGSKPHSLAAVGGTLFFSATDGLSGRELWRSNGTATGTRLLRDLNTATLDSVYPELGLSAPAGDRIYFGAYDGTHDGLWATDGTTGGTKLVASDMPYAYSQQAIVGTLCFFTPDAGQDLWVTDGTAPGTMHIGPSMIWPMNLTPLNGKLLFTRDLDPGLWISDGTDGGTVPLRADLSPRALKAFGDTAYFLIRETVGYDEYVHLWKTDGTPDGTVEVTDTDFATFMYLEAVGDTLYFASGDGSEGPYQLWKTNGTPEGTVMIEAIGGGEFRTAAQVGSSILFTAGTQLWVSDGTAVGTNPLKTFAGYQVGPLTAVGSTAYFAAEKGTRGIELWKSNGTAAGTVLVKDINPTGNSAPSDLANIGGTLYFAADDGTHGRELWRTNGTTAGTVMVADIDPHGSSSPTNFVKLGSTLVFVADDGSHGREPWSMPLP